MKLKMFYNIIWISVDSFDLLVFFIYSKASEILGIRIRHYKSELMKQSLFLLLRPDLDSIW